LAAIVERARESGAKVIFVQPQFSARGAQAVAGAIGGAVVPMDDLAYDYVANMEAMAKKVEAALGRSGQGARMESTEAAAAAGGLR
jgi:zinc transport system substrate-binding protein